MKTDILLLFIIIIFKFTIVKYQVCFLNGVFNERYLNSSFIHKSKNTKKVSLYFFISLTTCFVSLRKCLNQPLKSTTYLNI